MADLTFYRKQYIFYLPSLNIVSPKTGFELQQNQIVRNEDDKMFSNNLKNNKLEYTPKFGTQLNFIYPSCLSLLPSIKSAV